MEHVGPAVRIPQRLVGRPSVEDQHLGPGPVRQRLQDVAFSDDRDQTDAFGLQSIERRRRLLRRNRLRFQGVVHAREGAGRPVVLVAQDAAGKPQVGRRRVKPRDRRADHAVDPQHGRLHLYCPHRKRDKHRRPKMESISDSLGITGVTSQSS